WRVPNCRLPRSAATPRPLLRVPTRPAATAPRKLFLRRRRECPRRCPASGKPRRRRDSETIVGARVRLVETAEGSATGMRGGAMIGFSISFLDEIEAPRHVARDRPEGVSRPVVIDRREETEEATRTEGIDRGTEIAAARPHATSAEMDTICRGTKSSAK
ncbi:hypothetical protein PENTCL1PPCAC_1242, partial [Pristionchus entomophagus]